MNKEHENSNEFEKEPTFSNFDKILSPGDITPDSLSLHKGNNKDGFYG